ncbi:MAG: C-terminal target protein [Bacteroidota bacterium]|nr:C-terminal target protein [Bacteroidota bacterium]
MKLSLFLILSILCFALNAQVQVKPQSINAGGKSFQKVNAGVTFTVGEIIVKPMQTSDVILSNGMIASAVPFIVTKVVNNRNDFQFNLFPNPASQTATFKMESRNDLPVLLKITDIQGRVVMEQNLPHSFNEYSFSVNSWTKGMYILNVYGQQGESLGYIKFQKQ